MTNTTISGDVATIEAWELGETWQIKAHYLGTDWSLLAAFVRLDLEALDQLGVHPWEIEPDDRRPVVLGAAGTAALRAITR
jgi:hypothetical protein